MGCGYPAEIAQRPNAKTICNSNTLGGRQQSEQRPRQASVAKVGKQGSRAGAALVIGYRKGVDDLTRRQRILSSAGKNA